jgi:hypothetical protein
LPRWARWCAALVFGLGLQAHADEFEDFVAALYRPVEGERVALAPDGRHAAFSSHGPEGLAVKIIDLTDPSKTVKLLVEADRENAFSDQLRPARLRFLAWATPTRVVFAPTEYAVERGRRLAPIFAVNADGTQADKIAGADDFNQPQLRQITPSARLIGLIPENRTELLVDVPGRIPIRRSAITLPTARSGSAGFGQPIFDSAPRADPHPGTAVYRINVLTGKIVPVTTEENLGQFGYNRQGELELLLASSSYSDTRTYQYLPAGSRRWTDFPPEALGLPPAAFTLSPANYYGEHAYPLGVDFDRDVVYLASNVGRDTFAVEAFNLRTKARRLVAEDPWYDLAPNSPSWPGDTLIFDPVQKRLVGLSASEATPTKWLDPEVARWQRVLDAKFGGALVKIMQWDDAREHVLFGVTSGAEPGAYSVLDTKTGRVTTFLRSAPWLTAARLNGGARFGFTSPAGVRLTGEITFPRAARITPPPLVIYFPSNFGTEVAPAFDPAAQVLADMGMLVVRVNCRGAEGFGRTFRNAILDGVDRVPIDDALAAIDWVAKRHKIDRTRIVAYGQAYGGYLALRALQLEPNVFRCAVSMNGVVDLRQWLQRPSLNAESYDPGNFNFSRDIRYRFIQQQKGKPLDETSVLGHAELLTKPVFLMTASGDPNDMISAANRELAAKLKHLGRDFEYHEFSADFVVGIPKERVAAYAKLREFLYLNVYDFKVHVGEAKPLN